MIGNLINSVLFIAASCGFVLTGRLILSFGKFKLTPVERFAWSFVLGALVVSIALTGLGFAGLFNRPVAYALLALTFSAAFYRPRSLIGEITSSYRSVRRLLRSEKTLDSRVVLIVLVGLTVVFAVVALAPELRYDALQYHLELPKRYADAGRINFQHDIIQSAFPQAWGMLYGYGLLLASVQISKLFAFAAGVCALFTAYSAGRRLFGKSAGVFSALVVAATPVFAEYWPNAMADIPFMLLLAAAALTLVYGRKRIYRASVIGGLLLGFAAASRMQTLILAPVIFIVYSLIIASFKPGIKQAVASLVIMFGIAAALAAPWYVHNYIATGSMTGYFVTDVSRYEEWRTASSSESLFASIKQFLSAENFRGPRGDWHTKLLIPFLLTFKPNLWGQGIPGPFFLALLPAALLVRKYLRPAVLLAAIVFVTVLAWVFLLKETNVRYLIPAVIPGAVAAGYVLSLYLRSAGTGKIIGRLIIVFAVASSAFFVKHVAEYFPYGLGLKNPEELVVEKVFQGFDAITAVNSLPEGSLVLTGDGRTFYFEKTVIVGRPLHNLYFDTAAIKTPDEMLEWFQEHGITHTLAVSRESDFTFPGKPFRNPDGKYRFREDFLDVYGTVIAEGGRRNPGEYYQLYEMRYAETPP